MPSAEENALDRLILTHLGRAGPGSKIDTLAFGEIIAAEQAGPSFNADQVRSRLEVILKMNLRELGRLRARVLD